MLAAVAGCVAFVLVIVVPTAVSTTAAAVTACLPVGVSARGDVPQALRLDAEQDANARIIVATVVTRRMPTRAAVIAVATALQESSLRNLSYGDLDALGVFQQRPSQGWGSPLQVLDPAQATHQFLDRLQQIPDWPLRPLTEVAQAVQRSAFPNAYAQWERPATGIVNGLLARPAPTRADQGRDLPDLPGLLFLGNSQRSPSASAFPATFNGGPVEVDVRPGRTTAQIIKTLRAKESLPGTVVLSLETDETSRSRAMPTRNVAAALALVGPGRALFWLTGPTPTARQLTRALADAPQRDDELHVIDTEAALVAHPGWTDGDKLTSQGEAALTRLVLRTIGARAEQIPAPATLEPGCADGFAGFGSFGIGDCGFVLARQNPRTCQDAVRWALAQSDGPPIWLRRCLNFVAQAYGYTASGIPSAAQYWANAVDKHRADPTPPAGALVFWATNDPAGHVALSAGGAMVISNDVGGAGTITAIGLHDLTTQWNATYLGWAPPFFPSGI